MSLFVSGSNESCSNDPQNKGEPHTRRFEIDSKSLRINIMQSLYRMGTKDESDEPGVEKINIELDSSYLIYSDRKRNRISNPIKGDVEWRSLSHRRFQSLSTQSSALIDITLNSLEASKEEIEVSNFSSIEHVETIISSLKKGLAIPDSRLDQILPKVNISWNTFHSSVYQFLLRTKQSDPVNDDSNSIPYTEQSFTLDDYQEVIRAVRSILTNPRCVYCIS